MLGGKFNALQKDIYNIVLNAQTTAIRLLKPGVSWSTISAAAIEVITQGLIDLGILQGNGTVIRELKLANIFFPHGLGKTIF